MNFLEISKNRYTTKEYDASKKISSEKIQELKDVLRLSPSSINSQPWKFIFISDEALKRELAGVSPINEQRINNASHLVVFCAIDDIELFEERIKGFLPESYVAYYKQVLKSKGETAVKNWINNQVYLSLGYFLSACASLEVDSTPMEGIENEKYDEILKLDGYKTLFSVAIGYRDANDANQPSITPKLRLPLEQIIESI